MAGGEGQWHLREPVEGNPVVFMDVALGGLPAGRVKAELFADLCPRTAENFRQFCTGEFRPAQVPVGYKGAPFHRVIKGFMVQGGDPGGDGTGGESIWGGDFEDEFVHSLRHDRPFTLSMANGGPNTNGSQFFITTAPTPWLDNKHTVFGRCIVGMNTVSLIENVKTGKFDKPLEDQKIVSIEIIR